MIPGAVCCSFSFDFARPKSVSLTSPEYDSSTLARRDVAVDQLQVTVAVRVRQAARQLLDDVRGDLDREGHALDRAPVPGGQQVLALDEVERQVELPVLAPGVEHADQVPVRQAHHDHRLLAKALHVVGRHQVGQHPLDHAQLLHPGTPRHGQAQLAHAPPRQRLQQDIGAKPSWEPAVHHRSTYTRLSLEFGFSSQFGWLAPSAVRPGGGARRVSAPGTPGAADCRWRSRRGASGWGAAAGQIGPTGPD